MASEFWYLCVPIITDFLRISSVLKAPIAMQYTWDTCLKVGSSNQAVCLRTPIALNDNILLWAQFKDRFKIRRPGTSSFSKRMYKISSTWVFLITDLRFHVSIAHISYTTLRVYLLNTSYSYDRVCVLRISVRWSSTLRYELVFYNVTYVFFKETRHPHDEKLSPELKSTMEKWLLKTLPSLPVVT